MSDSTSPTPQLPLGQSNTNLQMLHERLYELCCVHGPSGEIQRAFIDYEFFIPTSAAADKADALVSVLREATKIAEQVAAILRLRDERQQS